MEAYLVFRFWRVFEPSGGQILVECHALHFVSYLNTLLASKTSSRNQEIQGGLAGDETSDRKKNFRMNLKMFS